MDAAVLGRLRTSESIGGCASPTSGFVNLLAPRTSYAQRPDLR
jgi:hypothetical protein